MGIREAFVSKFGESEAVSIEQAAERHNNDIHSDKGSDAFRWAIAICIGYECMSKDAYREWHEITAPWDELKQWIIEHGNLQDHDGDVDFLSMFIGVYDEFVGLKKPEGVTEH